MNIIGINAFHADASAAIFVNGKMIAAIEEGIPKINESGESSVMGHCSSCMTGNYTIPVQNEI
jgi:predicted NodU family carbamoyl transferase